MADFDISFTGPGGSDPVVWTRNLVQAAMIQKSDMEIAGETLKQRILTRTLSGRDVYGHNFTAYSPEYAKRKGRWGSAAPVDLYGRKLPHMLDVIKVNADPYGFSLSIDGEESVRAQVLNEGGQSHGKRRRRNPATGRMKLMSYGLPPRRFFDASQADLEIIEAETGREIEKRIEKL